MINKNHHEINLTQPLQKKRETVKKKKNVTKLLGLRWGPSKRWFSDGFSDGVSENHQIDGSSGHRMIGETHFHDCLVFDWLMVYEKSSIYRFIYR